MVRISIVVPAYNSAKWLDRCLAALLDQRYPAELYEVIVVDNNSTDGTREIARQYTRARLLAEPRQGSYFARNTGIQASSGEVIAFTDADCIAAPGWLNAIDSEMRDGNLQVLLGAREYVPLILRSIAQYENLRIRWIYQRQLQAAYFGFTNNMAVRKQAFDRHGSFPAVARGADTIFIQRVTRVEGAAAASWNADMRVTHLELSGPWSYLNKNYLYATARKRTQALGQCEELRLPDAFRLLKSACQSLSVLDQICLVLLLGAGRITWRIASLL